MFTIFRNGVEYQKGYRSLNAAQTKAREFAGQLLIGDEFTVRDSYGVTLYRIKATEETTETSYVDRSTNRSDPPTTR